MPVTFEGRFDGCAPSKYCLHRFPQCIGAFGAAFDGGRPSTYYIRKRLLSGRSRRRLWKVSQRQPIPTALLLITTESVPAGTARSVTEEADSRTQDRLYPPSGTDRAAGVRRLSVSLGGSLLRDGISGGFAGTRE